MVLLPPQLERHRGLPTLVLDLDNTLIDGPVRRPGLDQFLEAVKPLYEVVIFTAGTKECAEKVIDEVDKDHRCITYRLYGDSRVNFVVKPAESLGRDMKKVVVVDDKPETYKNNVNNALPILAFTKDKAEVDEELHKLIPFLTRIAKVDDVRKPLWELRNGKAGGEKAACSSKAGVEKATRSNANAKKGTSKKSK